MKFILYSNRSDWQASNSEMNTYFSLPDGIGCERYAEIMQVGNEQSANYGKYIFPVCVNGDYACTDQFPSNEQVDFDPSWNLPPE
tara:strand:+ start:420 stop:674 length:255 start_codon:yes stop_codon:yes gene_type:complete